jgi:hypothetical protein
LFTKHIKLIATLGVALLPVSDLSGAASITFTFLLIRKLQLTADAENKQPLADASAKFTGL